MNRSFSAQDSLMPSIRPRVPQLRSLKEPTMKEKEDDLALFLEMRKREKEKNDLLLHNSYYSGFLYNIILTRTRTRTKGLRRSLRKSIMVTELERGCK